jgi:hypothetical protein
VVEEQIQSLQAKIAEKKLSNDKPDLWLVEHWERQITILKEQLKNENRL